MHRFTMSAGSWQQIHFSLQRGMRLNWVSSLLRTGGTYVLACGQAVDFCLGFGAGGGNRTHTGSEPHGILCTARLPV